MHRLKQENPHLHISINGGIETLDETEEHLRQADGVMIGRAAYYQPALLAEADSRLFSHLPNGKTHVADMQTLAGIARDYASYMQQWKEQGVRLSAMSRHLVSLFQQVPGARLWRRHLSEQANSAIDARTLVEDGLHYLFAQSQRAEELLAQRLNAQKSHAQRSA